MYQSLRLEVRLTPYHADTLDRIRGDATRSEWVRAAILAAGHPDDALHPTRYDTTTDADHHRHRPANLLDETDLPNGTTVQRWECVCGHQMETLIAP